MLEALLAGQLSWNIPMLISLIGITIAYIFYAKYRTNSGIRPIQMSMFFICVGCFFIIIGSPLQMISHVSFSLHMIHMSIFYFFIPPFALLCIPQLLQFSNPIKIIFYSKIALYGFAIGFLLYHIPNVILFFSQYTILIRSYEYFLFILALLMWWPLMLQFYEEKKRYAFLNSMLLMPSCLLLILAALLDAGNNPMLSMLSKALCMPENVDLHPLPFPFNTGIDQFVAGLIMLLMHKMVNKLTLKRERNE